MAKFCTGEHATCTCQNCCETRYRAIRQERIKAELRAEQEAIALAKSRHSQLRLPMPGLAHCAGQPASLDDPPPLQLEILRPQAPQR